MNYSYTHEKGDTYYCPVGCAENVEYSDAETVPSGTPICSECGTALEVEDEDGDKNS